MPQEPSPKAHQHPFRLHAERAVSVAAAAPIPSPYTELQVTSNFTFLTGASHPDELAARAAELGYSAVAITDRNSLAGIVRAHVAAKEAGIRLVVGCRLDIAEPRELSVLVYPTDRAAYARLCRLLTLGKRRADKGECHLSLHDLIEYSPGLIAAVVPPRMIDEDFIEAAWGLKSVFDDDRLSLVACRAFTQDDDARLLQLAALSGHTGISLVAANDVQYHDPARRPLHDVLSCIRHGCTIAQAGFRLGPNAERYLKPPDKMHRLFARYPLALRRTIEITERTAGFSLDQLKYEYPDEVVPPGTTPMGYLRDLTRAGACDRYPAGVPASVVAQIEHELRLIGELNYAPYFLTVHDLVAFARSKGILCQGRGAAANSAVCYCLGVTAVDPDRVSMLFERFISKERDEPPDIDIDFEHERREEVIQYIYAKYGRDRAALTAEVISYRGRSAVRDVGKAMGLSLDCVDRMAKELSGWDAEPPPPERLRELGLNPSDPTLAHVLRLCREISGFPRHLSQHVGGFVIARSSLCELVPIENAAMPDRTVIEWDKDDIEALGMLKVDCLGLGMLTCIRKCLDLVEQHEQERWSLATIPADDLPTYDMICNADTVGVFQIESRAQMSMLPRLKPRCYYDLVIEVAIVRPGPIQGKMVHPYLRRRNGEEQVAFASPEIKRVLGRTLGVPLFQEQAMALAVAAAGFTPGEADQLRRAMAAWKRSGRAILRFEEKLISGMLARGYTEEFARQVFQQISGFSGYGFPESHAASFALLVYSSSWLKRHHPAAFAAALINSQPMGFYQPAQIVRDAQAHGVEVRPIDVNHSRWDCTLEERDSEAARQRNSETARQGQNSGLRTQDSALSTADSPALRLGMRLVGGLQQAEAERVAQAVMKHGPASTIESLRRRSTARVASLRKLAQADAFASMGLTRQRALWALRAIRDESLPLFDDLPPQEPDSGDAAALPPVAPCAEVSSDYRAAGLSLKAHPLSFIRDELDAMGVTRNETLPDEVRCPQGTRITVSGIVLVRQRPATASGIVFMTLEDETGTANLIVRPKVFERFRRAARHSRVLVCSGTVERQGQVVHVQAKSLRNADEMTAGVPAMSRDFH